MRGRAGRRTMGLGLLALAAGLLAAAPAGALPLLPHHAVYALSLDGSKPTGQLEDMSGEIDYRLTGDACVGYDTVTRQVSESRTGDGDTNRQEITTTAWEAGDASSYRFSSTTAGPDDTYEEVAAEVSRKGPDAIEVKATKPKPRTFEIKGQVLMPTEHVLKVLGVGAGGGGVLSAKVYDGASDAAKVYDTLSVVGAARAVQKALMPAAGAALAGHVYYPVSVSYYEPGPVDRPPAYVMSFSLYDNGVVGDMKIDYGRFALIGVMAKFEASGGSGGCSR